MVTPIYEKAAGSRSYRKSDDHDKIKEETNRYLTRLQPKDNTISYDDMVASYWSADYRAVADEVISRVAAQSMRHSRVKIERYLFIEHEALPTPIEVLVPFNIITSQDYDVRVWPEEAFEGSPLNRFIGTPELDVLAHRVAVTALECGLVKECFHWLLNNCTNHEQAAYLCPGWIALCRRADIDFQGDGRKPRSLPDVPPMMRMRLRWLHNFLAMHELMETFSTFRGMGGRLKEGMCEVTLDGTLNVERPIGDFMFKVKFE